METRSLAPAMTPAQATCRAVSRSRCSAWRLNSECEEGRKGKGKDQCNAALIAIYTQRARRRQELHAAFMGLAAPPASRNSVHPENLCPLMAVSPFPLLQQQTQKQTAKGSPGGRHIYAMKRTFGHGTLWSGKGPCISAEGT